MDPGTILERMKAYFVEKQPPEVLAAFSEQTPEALLKESLDWADFIVYLEEELEREIDVAQLGTALMSMNFGELAVEVSRMLADSAA